MATSLSENTRLWDKALKSIEAKINEKKTFDSFFANSYIYEIKRGTIYIIAPTLVAKAVMMGQYKKLILSVISDLSEEDYDICVMTEDEVSNQKGPVIKKNVSQKENSQSTYFANAKINPNLTFDKFVVGDFNKEAHRAALYVAKNDGNLFNPLFIYSNSGLGKTHLLHAIGNEILATRMPDAKILYITAEDFTDEYIRYVRAERDNQSLKDFFHDVDVLLLDDVQFLANKVKTEEMFFYVFEYMVKNNKRIIITSDRQPSELKGLEDRLVTRFAQGLTVKINDPDKDTCIHILEKKINEEGLDIKKVDPAVITFLADNFSRNVRELEGAINRLIFRSLSSKEMGSITIDIAIDAIGSLKGGNSAAAQLSEQKIINTVADYYNINAADITGKVRTGQIALARHISMYLVRKHLDIPLKKIGEAFGGKDHTTVMSGIDKVEKELKTSVQLQQAVEELERLIEQ